MITLTNPDTGQRHPMDAAAFKELREAFDAAKAAERDHLVFRAMLLDLDTARNILAAE